MIQWVFRKNRLLVVSLLFLFVFSLTLQYVFATPPGSAYTPAETLQPACNPGDTNCTVLDNLGIGSTITSGTEGSVLFAGASGVLAQDNTNFFWDDTNNQLRLGAGTASLPTYTFAGDTTTGFYSVSAGTIGLTFSGTQRYGISSTSIVSGTAGGFTLIRASGSASSPTYTFSGDTNTGIYRSGADTLEFSTGGNERARFDSSGNFGLGETSPASLFTVGSGDLFQVNSSGAIAAATGITSSGTINFSGLSASLAVFTDGSKNLTSLGTLGVGQGGTALTSTPTNGQLLIGNGTGYTLATITAGTGVSVVTGSGSITVSATGAASNEFADNVFRIIDDGDASKKIAFESSGITTATTRTLTVPDASGTLALTTTPGTSGSDVNWSSTGTLNIPDASTSVRGLVTTGSQSFSGGKSFTGNVSLNSSTLTYRTTNAGSNISSQILADMDGSASTSGSQAVAFETANGMVFTVANGTRRIARAALKITNAVNTAGSETGDLSFYTKASGAAIAERFRIDSDGKLFVTSGLAASSGTPDALCMNTSTYEITHNTGTATCTVSSSRFKYNIVTYSDSGLDIINLLRPVTYMYNETTIPRVGFVAEDVEQIDTKLMFYETDGVTPRGVRYEDIVPVLTKAIQEIDFKLEPLSTLNLNTTGSLGNLIKQFLENAENNIQTFFANKIQTHELCLDEVCITKDQLQNLLNQNNGGGTSGTGDNSTTGDDQGSDGSDDTGGGTGDVVEDTTPPVITIIGDAAATLLVGDTYLELGATAVDETDGDITASIIISGTVDTQTAGIYTITYTVTDAAGNTGTAVRTIEII